MCTCILFAFTSAAQAVSNPILPNADPFITPEPVNGRYLLLATPEHDLTIWSGPTIPTAASKATVIYHPQGLREVWSPTLWHEQGRWWVYFTARERGKEHAIYALQSNTADPLGSYSFEGELKLDRPAIDPSLLIVKGVSYLMYVTVDRGENEIHLVRMAGPMQPTGPSSLLAMPLYPWEKGAGSGQNWPIVEGPTALYHDRKTFIVYSGSETRSPMYCLGLLRLRHGDPLDPGHWARSTQPSFSASPANDIYGPGRGTFAHAADGTDWLLYAARNNDRPTPEGRYTRAQRFGWKHDGEPDFGVPPKDGPIPDASSDH